jgi:hypothetical protein
MVATPLEARGFALAGGGALVVHGRTERSRPTSAGPADSRSKLPAD